MRGHHRLLTEDLFTFATLTMLTAAEIKKTARFMNESLFLKKTAADGMHLALYLSVKRMDQS